ncbi:MAG: glutamine-hydrolyzing GMP synthase subunit GuaA, partial [Methanosarcinales archaeon]|nr:glutamine-hydrolyzing GMP synthase subunit GuaA [Methanosarcinales archaeon]
MVKVDKFIENAVKQLKTSIDGPTIIGLSGGVDSSVCAVLAHRAI